VRVVLVGLVGVVCLVGVAHAVQPDKREQPDRSNRPYDLGEPVDWDMLPNGLLIIQYDQTGDGMPDRFTLHQITWSGWTGQSVEEIEAQAKLDRQWAFIVEYDRDRYVYFTESAPLSTDVPVEVLQLTPSTVFVK
jgi:hypothetical protein